MVLPATDLLATQGFFVDRLGFSLVSILGADDPQEVVLEGRGLRVRLDRAATHAPGVLRVPGIESSTVLVAPNGTRIETMPSPDAVTPMQPVRARSGITHPGQESAWHTGRAGMQYRDLVPDRAGGGLIVSHIRIPDGGEVPDYVHHHAVSFQVIFCARGWVEVVYEDQGPPFRMVAGDCVLQPPHIRHRVLWCSPGFEVYEAAAPAVHETFVDREMTLPTTEHRPDRDFGGQRFVRHQVANATWSLSAGGAWEVRDTGIAAATGDLGRVLVWRVPPGGQAATVAGLSDPGRALVAVVLNGHATVSIAVGAPEPVHAGSCIVLAPDDNSEWSGCSPDLEVLTMSLRSR